MSLIHINKVSKDYHLGKTIVHALTDININIEKGDFIAVAGPSGSGKTTLLNLIGTLDTPTAGEIIFEERNVSNLPDREATRVRATKLGFIFQTFNLVPVLNVFENVEFPLLINERDNAENRKDVTELLTRVGLEQYQKHRPDELSGGQRQRVAIARALINKPMLILADEPTANLDSKTGENIVDIMLKMNKELGTTFIFSTHDPKVVRHATKKIYLVDGQVDKVEGNNQS
ncbi:MAG: ABC transporter ATP-binding protein [Candidatus Margulisbacteria bacterium]|nr:ABC transporter ATP-binding protein [Candidatus Margulisiibacteriota bacterium]MBU1021144.1 ABC transporter ATP-binding protein [Candidatus Margulisiibacteriota bacterium]MBU1729750.1 ABC transporter ATP-binding protein [Candidatus Margulisiibacteriota bacterium]MBU1955251.1 ABC transporter ATP-binding protein [Candidatus Margulisiibacteriota bacterium]